MTQQTTNLKPAILLLVPLLLFMALPVISVHAVTPNVEVGVECESLIAVQTGASITVLGHSALVLCPSGSDQVHEMITCFSLSAPAKFTAKLTAGGLSLKQKGTFSSLSGGYIEGYLYAPQDGESYGSWWVAGYCE